MHPSDMIGINITGQSKTLKSDMGRKVLEDL
jgi:hypothetical protein